MSQDSSDPGVPALATAKTALPQENEAGEWDAEAWLGRVIEDRYRITELLGEGGMGAVFVADHLRLHKPVALKIIHPELVGNDELAVRFAREAMASAQIEHPHVVAALDYGPLPEGGAFLVTQLVRGRPLGELIEEHGTSSWQHACQIMAQVADALATAHAQGIIHRDIKPDNILIETRDDGSPFARVLDFGIARIDADAMAGSAMGASPGLTKLGTVMGTPGYMPPEQALGKPVDATADLYALGVILWEMVTGHPLFGGEQPGSIITEQITTTPPVLTARISEAPVPAALQELLSRLTASDPNERPSSAGEVRDALRRILLEGGSHTGPTQTHRFHVSTGVEATPAARRRLPLPLPLLIGLGAAAVIGLVALGVVLGSSGSDDEDAGELQGGGSVADDIIRTLTPQTVLPSVPPEVEAHIRTMMSGDQRNDRRAAAEWIRAHRPADEVPPYALLAADLELGRSCRERKDVVQRLRELGDERALPALERIDQSPRRGCGFLGARDCYSCMRSDVSETIAALGGSSP